LLHLAAAHFGKNTCEENEYLTTSMSLISRKSHHAH
jgi:hypothetical protein